MNRTQSIQFQLSTPEDTAGFAISMAPLLKAGDTLLLTGNLGSGKTHFARALIQGRLSQVGLSEDVPSPTYTLVQTYSDGFCDIWHADLYRITNPDEVIELGLTDAFLDAICLIEWPDRLTTLSPASAIGIEFNCVDNPSTRIVSIRWSDNKWSKLAGIFENYHV